MFDLLLRADGEPLSDNELRDQVFTIIDAGYGASATLVNWAIERLVHASNALAAATAEASGSDEQMPLWTRSCTASRTVLIVYGRVVVAEDVVPRVFDAFCQGQSADRCGTGLRAGTP